MHMVLYTDLAWLRQRLLLSAGLQRLALQVLC